MKALVRKDFYVLWKQMRYLIFVLLVVAAANGSFGSVFIVIWAALLPYTAMAYDERSKWDQLAAMMPYTAKDLVLSKYVLGWLCAGGASVAALVLQTVINVTGIASQTGTPASILLGLCGSLCIMDITLPLMLRFGVEKGRLLMFLMVFLVCGGAGAIASAALSGVPGNPMISGPVLALAPAAALVLTLLSIPLSLKLYRTER